MDEVILPGSEGYLGVRPGHLPLLVGLGVGELSWRRGGRQDHMAVARGYAEVLPDRVVVLAAVAERAEEIDTERAGRARARAEEMLASHDDQHVKFDQAKAALLRAVTRLSVAAKKE